MEEMRIGQQVKLLSNLIRRNLDGILSGRYGLTVIQGRLIRFLIHNQDRDVFQRDVENEFQIRRPTASQILKLMESKGLVIRETVAFDARLKKITLTPEAVSVHNDLIRHFDLFERKLKEGIPEEDLQVFFEVIRKMQANME